MHRMNLDCADICDTTGRVLSRHTGYDANLTRTVLEACAQACKSCGEVCVHHGRQGVQHCQVCADECRRCEAACREMLTTAFYRAGTVEGSPPSVP
ncbi:four-helix bundle copper-binding protein [Pseudonocardia nigra]|uniref:four-helix bundle copper-binding protein n=1 Tax=Pseudonocardia nigra TaxID=1921578 RepID=UPI0027E27316|nr:four-helix bundle copper-binding protein [Pseudonocardia nigra]